MKILVINCGSSSLKYQLIDSQTEEAVATGICERIGIDGRFTYKPKEGTLIKEKEVSMENHQVAVQIVLDALTDSENGVVKSLEEIEAIGHRVVHGGEKFASSVIIDESVIEGIEACSDLAPLHNPANLVGIRACRAIMPEVPNVAVFDTAFHQTMPKEAYLYALPIQYYEDYKVRRYGFHGTSHSYVSNKAAQMLGLDIKNSKIIVCHLGNGSSVSAVLNGESIDTSMGLTPLEGVPMGTRSGDLDPAIIEYIAGKEGKTLEEMIHILNKQSGVYGVSGGVSSDFRDLHKSYENDDNQNAWYALKMFAYRVAKYVGGYISAMNGVDAIVFTAGVGENDYRIRKWVMEYFGYMGITIDDEINATNPNGLISTMDSRIRVMVIPTNEELAIARETVELLG